MNYLLQYCQRVNRPLLKSLLLLCSAIFLVCLASCSSDPRPSTIELKAKSVLAEPVWFNAPERFTLRTDMHDIVTHPFFDLTAFRTKDSMDLSYFLTTPVGSAHQYDLDMVSGQLYRKRTYCEQKDIWESFSEKINRPNFSIGIIPRLLDQTSEPQMVWVFGDKDYLFDSEDKGRSQSQRTRIVGGFVLQFCNDYPCRTYQSWLSRLVLVGVNSFDPKFKNVSTLKELKGKVNWPYVKAFAQNGWGRTTSSTVPEPAYRMVGEVEAEKALDFAFKSGHSFTFDEINSLRKNCFYLYDYLWRSQEKVRKNMMSKAQEASDKLAKEIKRANERMKAMQDFKMNTVFSSSIEKDLRSSEGSREEQSALVDFKRFFLNFYSNYGERFRTCTKFVRPANHKENSDRAWFFAFMTNWFHLEDLDYYYMCPRRSWLKNPRLTSGKRRFDLKEKRQCSSLDLDESFEQSVTVMASLAGADKPHYRFVEYDYGIGGSHKELYSWVPDNGKKLGCNARSLEEKVVLFPEDVEWKDFFKNIKRGRFDTIR
ncbi:MAG: hypothetical protein K9K67_09470 [Bacteriovoracaceae bacterium]|nr:hypothetical protein [Bacteriovoracaceae bacterium]